MKLLLSRVLFTLLFTLSLNASVILQAEGSGSDEKSAKKSALLSLASIISVELDSSTSSSLKSVREDGVEKTSSNIEQNSNIKTESYLSAVKYEEIEHSKNTFKYRAILDDDALRKSISMLKDAIFKNISNLSEKELRLLLKKSEYLLVLLNYDSGIVSKKEVIAKRDEISNTLNMSRVELNVTPKDAKIYINGKVFENLKTHFLKAGKNSLKVEKDGYFGVEKTFYTQKNRVSEIKLNLIKKGAIPSEVNVRGTGKFLNDVKRELLKYNMKYSSSSDYIFEFSTTKTFITEVGGMRVYSLQVVADFKHNSTLLVSKKAKLKSVVEPSLRKKELALIKALLKADIKAYSNKN